MRLLIGMGAVGLLLSLCAIRAEEESSTCRVRVRLVDAEPGEKLPGLVRVRGADGREVKIDELLPRGQGLGRDLAIQQWYVLSGPSVVSLPREELTISAFSGLETEQTNLKIDLRQKSEAEVSLELKRFYDAHAAGYRNANTHVHLRKITRPESDRYLIETATADGLDLVFVSYLERAEDDADYITNRYSREEIEALSTDHVHFGHGEEHRHNFTAYEEGYGHVMLLNIPELIYPVSIGPGISKTGTDGIPLRRGIDRARESGGSVIWCHNHWGLEDIPNWLTGRLHANNIFDGGSHGSYRHSYYRYWDAGIKVPVSTGTDWFIYDFSRVYVPADHDLTVEEWLEQLRAGRSYITNGPFLEFTVDGHGVGADVQLDAPGTVRVSGRADGRVDFGELQLIQDGRIVRSEKSTLIGGHFSAGFDIELMIDSPSWLALRTPPPSVPDDASLTTKTPANEYGRELFSHTSVTFVEIDGRRSFDVQAAEELLAEMKDSRTFISERGLFADEAEQRHVLAVYEEGIAELTSRIQTSESGR